MQLKNSNQEYTRMFCYCTNNAMKEEPEAPVEVKNIDDVLMTMLVGQNNINKTKNAIKELEPRIYSTIKDPKEGKVQKKKVLNFIKSQFTKQYQESKNFKYCIEMLEQYFHLEGKNDEYECTKNNLTEIFWEEKEGGEQIEKPVQEIRAYFYTIVNSEYKLRNAFKEYYKAKKKENVTVQEGDILEKIMQECCGKETGGDLQTKFLANLGKLCDNDENLKGNKEAILAAIQRRITLNEPIKEEDIKSFLKQKIGEEKKVVEQKILEIDVNPKGGCCTCCDCWGKKKNQVEEPQEEQQALE